MSMICIRAEIPPEICEIDDALKAIYHGEETVCIWTFESRKGRNRFVDETIGMVRDDRQNHFEKFFFKPSVWKR